jgi:hypothetical protein
VRGYCRVDPGTPHVTIAGDHRLEGCTQDSKLLTDRRPRHRTLLLLGTVCEVKSDDDR